MHVSRFHVRLLALVAGVFAIMLAFGAVGQGPQHQAEAAGGAENTVTCADIYFNESLLITGIGPDNPGSGFGDPPPPGGVVGGSLLLGKTMTRQNASGGVATSSHAVSLLSSDVDGYEPVETGPGSLMDSLGFADAIGDVPPTNQPCETKVPAANSAAEPVDRMKMKAGIITQYRPGDGTVFDYSKGTGPNGGDVFTSVSCSTGGPYGWIRTESYTEIVNTGPKSVNYGQAALFFYTNSPPLASQVDIDNNGEPDYTTDPEACTGGTQFPSYTVVVARDARTDDPSNVKDNVELDLDGPTSPPGGPIAVPQDPDGTVETAGTYVADDWDGDGCTDWDELSASLKAGLNPFNPEDCDQDIEGVFNLLVTADKTEKKPDPNGFEDDAGAAGDGTCSDTLDNDGDTAIDGDDSDCFTINEGTYFHCIIRLEQPTPTTVDANAACYQDSLALAGASSSAVPSYSDGWAGAPPPPPYTGAVPVKLNGTRTDKHLDIVGCFPNQGPPLGPNINVDVDLDLIAGGTLKGSVVIFGLADDNECNAKTGGIPLSGGTVTAAEQSPGPDGLLGTNDDFDHDGDGCTDWDELGHDKAPPTSKKCGDDPYNPYDSGRLYNPTNSEDGAGPNTCVDNQDNGDGDGKDADDDDCYDDIGVSGSYSTLAIVNENGQKHAKATGGLPGGYFHCVTEVDHDTATNDLTASIYCYTDTVLLDDNGTTGDPNDDTLIGIGVNVEDSGTIVCDPVPVGTPVDTTKCGDGHPGPNPPGPAGNGTRTWGDVDDPHTVLTGTYDDVNNVMRLEGCYENVENPTQGPNVYVRAVIPAHAGNGTTDIWLNRPDCTKPASEPDAPYNDVVTESARNSDQVGVWDTDQDGCTNAKELASGVGSQATGGLRDPYNYWDFRDVPSGTPPVRDAVVSVGDISAVVGVFGTAGNPLADPVHTDNKGGYHTAYDTGGGIVGSAGVWNVRGPDGAISVGDITAIVNQFGHAC